MNDLGNPKTEVEMAVAMSDEMRQLFVDAGELDERAREILEGVPGMEAKATALVLELSAIRATLEAAALAELEPPRFVGDQVDEVPEGWYRISFMGHRERHGYVSTVRLAGRQLVEVREPMPLVGIDGEATGEWRDVVERYAAQSVYSICESSEDDAKRDALEELNEPRPF